MKKLSLNETIELIAQAVAGVTGKKASDIDVDQPFLSMGLESLQAVTVASQVSKKLERTLEPTLLFDYPTVRRMAEFLVSDTSVVRVQTNRRVSDRIDRACDKFE